MASLVAILDLKGTSLIQRSYRDDVPEGVVARFLPNLLDLEDEGRHETPCFSKDGINFMYIRHANLYCECRKVATCDIPGFPPLIITVSAGSLSLQCQCGRDYLILTSACTSPYRILQRARGRVDQG